MLSSNYDTQVSLVQRMTDNGQAFRAFKEFDIPANGEITFSVKTGDKAVGFYSRLIVPNQPDIRYEVRTGATIDSYVGDPIKIRNLNSKKNTPSTCLFRQCTQEDLGELVDIDLLPGQAGSGSNSSGDIYRDPDDLKINSDNTEYLLRLVNDNGTVAKTLLYLKWFEVPKNLWD